MKDAVFEAMAVCPEAIVHAVERTGGTATLEEIRFRMGREVMLIRSEGECMLSGTRTDGQMLDWILGRATGQALYAAREMLKEGFVTLAGGHRIGVCGTGVVKNGELFTLREISSLNLRIAREIRGFGTTAAEQLRRNPVSTLILGAPGSGKTTLLRDVIRQCSDRLLWRIAVVDERGEVAACHFGQPQFDLGRRTDVLSAVKKSTGIEMLLRGMNPQWIALDEITAAEDIDAMVRAGHCGVRFLATLHAASFAEMDKRPLYRTLMQTGIFETRILLDKHRNLQIERGGAAIA